MEHVIGIVGSLVAQEVAIYRGLALITLDGEAPARWARTPCFTVLRRGTFRADGIGVAWGPTVGDLAKASRGVPDPVVVLVVPRSAVSISADNERALAALVEGIESSGREVAVVQVAPTTSATVTISDGHVVAVAGDGLVERVAVVSTGESELLPPPPAEIVAPVVAPVEPVAVAVAASVPVVEVGSVAVVEPVAASPETAAQDVAPSEPPDGAVADLDALHEADAASGEAPKPRRRK